MSLAQRFERRLESVVGSAFARVFKGQVEPVEIGTALQREATDKRNVMGNGRGAGAQPVSGDVVAVRLRAARAVGGSAHQLAGRTGAGASGQNGWRTIGDIEVYLARDDALHTGVFGVASRMESNAPPRRRPYDSLSLPAVPGVPPGAYRRPRPTAGMPPMGVPVPGRGPGPGMPPPAHAAARSAAWHAARTAGRRAQRSAAARRHIVRRPALHPAAPRRPSLSTARTVASICSWGAT